MSRYNKSRTFPIALVLIIVAVAIAALISVTRAIFFSGDNQSTTQTDVSQEALISTAADREVRMTVRGAIVANEDFHSYLIAITPSSRVLSAYTGYMDKNVDQQVGLGNNIPAYEELVYALSRANLVKGTELTGDQNDTRGICATGLLYRFEILKNNRPVKNLWTSTCKGSSGSLDASVDQLKALFIAQIPDAPSRISKIDL